MYGREKYTALVGAPGQAVVYVFEYDESTEEWNQAQVRNHNHSQRLDIGTRTPGTLPRETNILLQAQG